MQTSQNERENLHSLNEAQDIITFVICILLQVLPWKSIYPVLLGAGLL